LFVHITNLKQIQIAFGREAGDEVLRHVIEQTRGSLRVADILFGDANDELIALLHATDTSTAENIASRIRVKIGEPVALATGAMLRIHATITAVCAPDDGVSLQDLFSAAILKGAPDPCQHAPRVH